MSKLENWGDLYKYTKELMDDEFNHGQALVVKTKSKAADNTTVSSISSSDSLFQDLHADF